MSDRTRGIDTRMDQYQILGEISRGGMGIVYRAQDRLNGGIVALKKVLLAPDQLNFNSRMRSSTMEDVRLALAHEFQMLASLRHPHIISVRDYGFAADDGLPYFTMDYLSDSRTIIDAARDTSLHSKIVLAGQMLDALAYLHQRGVIHRDLKPGNVLVYDGAVRVLDFGLAQAGHDPDSYGRILGTLMYMSPEALSGMVVTPATDLYAVGLILYEMLTDSFPFDRSDTTRMLNAIMLHPPDFSVWEAQVELDPSVRIGLLQILNRLLEKDARARYQHAHDVRRELYAAVGLVEPAETAAVRESYLQSASFVGRYHELTTLLDALSSAQNGRGGAWLVGGESGVGKSRLIDELRTRAMIRGMIVMRGQAVSSGGVSFQLWREPLRRLLLRADVRAALTDLDASVLKAIVPDIATLIDHDVQDAADVDSKTRQQRLQHALISAFGAVAQPMLLILEDIQWTQESLPPLAALSETVLALPLLVVASFRNDERPDIPVELPHMHMMRLERLTQESIAALSESMLGETGRHPEVIELLTRETEGNVFFLVETVRALAEEAGRLSDIGRSTLPARVLTGGMQAVVARRLNGIPHQHRPLLNAAAVIGRQVDFRLLRHFTSIDDPRAADRALEAWLTVGVNAAVFDWQDGTWRFAHDKLREAVLDALDDAERARLHRSAALAIEQAYPDDDALAGVLADHWQRAGDAEKEAGYLAKSALHAFNYGQFHDALRMAERGDAITHDATLKRTFGLRLGEANMRLSRYDDAVRVLKHTLALAHDVGDHATAGHAGGLLANCCWETGDYTDGLRYAEQSMRDAEIASLPTLQARAHNIYANLNWYMGNYALAEQHFHRSLAAAESAHALREMSVALTNIGLVFQENGDIDRAFEYMNRSHTIKEQVGDIRGLVVLAINLADLVKYRGDREGEMRYAQRAVKLASTLGDRVLQSSTLRTLGIAYDNQNMVETAVQYMNEALAISRAVGDRPGAINALSTLANLYHKLGERDKQQTMIVESIRLCLEIGAAPRLMHALVNLVDLYVANGDYEGALTLLYALEGHSAFKPDMRDTFWKKSHDRALEHLPESERPASVSAARARAASMDVEAYARQLAAAQTG